MLAQSYVESVTMAQYHTVLYKIWDALPRSWATVYAPPSTLVFGEPSFSVDTHFFKLLVINDKPFLAKIHRLSCLFRRLQRGLGALG